MEFQGSHILSVDGKGRIVMPVSYREQLRELCDGKLVIGQTFREHCISLYPAPEYARVREQLLRDRNATPQYQRLLRALVGLYHPFDMPASGRILIPKRLRTHNSIDKDVLLIGLETRFEIWDQDEFDSYCGEADSGSGEEFQEILEKLTI